MKICKETMDKPKGWSDGPIQPLAKLVSEKALTGCRPTTPHTDLCKGVHQCVTTVGTSTTGSGWY